jgi:ribosome-associated heat shock protein Hsp15
VEFVRLDIWLDVACLFKTRSEAQKAVKAGKVDVNGNSAKPHRELRLGDELLISRPHGRRQRIIVRGLLDKHVAKAEARALYEDVTPPPSPQEVEMMRMARLARPFVRAGGAGAPDKRERRQIRKVKEGR